MAVDPQTERAALLQRIHDAFATLNARAGVEGMPAQAASNLETLALPLLQHLANQLEAQVAALPAQPDNPEKDS